MVSSLLAGAAGGAGISIIISAVDKFSGVFANVNKAMIGVGIGITALGLAGVGISKSLIDTAASFETAFTGVRKTVDLSEAEFEVLEKRFKTLSTEIPVTFQELSRIGEIAGQLGVEGVDNLTEFTKVIADISATTDLTAEAAATDFARIANIMGIPISQVDKMGATIVGLGNNFAAVEPEIVGFATRIAGAGKIVGLTTDQLFGWGTAMASVGLEAESGGTAFQRALLLIDKAVITGGDKLTLFAKTAGLTSEEFVKLWEKDASGAMEKFVAGLGTKGSEAAIILDELGLGNVRTTRTFLSLSSAGDKVTSALGSASILWKENTALVEEAEKRYATTDSQVKILKNKFASLKDDMGKQLIPTFIKLVDVLGKVIGWFEKHPKLTKFIVVALAVGTALALIIGPLLILIALKGAIIGMITAVGSALLFLMANPIGIAIVAIGLLIAASLWLIKNQDKVKEAMRVTWNFISKKITSNINLIIKGINLLIKVLNKIPGVNIGKIKELDFSISKKASTISTGNGGTTNVINISGNVTGTDPDDMAEAFADKMDNVIRL